MISGKIHKSKLHTFHNYIVIS